MLLRTTLIRASLEGAPPVTCWSGEEGGWVGG